MLNPQTESSAPTLDRTPGVILYVEDHDDTRLATGALLKAAGFDLREAATSEAALAQVDSLRGSLDVVIVDYHLGGEMTGTEVAESLSRLLGHGVPTVILTGDPANADMPWLRNSPVWLVRKPACPQTLIAGVNSLVSFRRAIKQVAKP